MDDTDDAETTPQAALDAAFAATPREWFLPPEAQREAGEDRPVHLREGQTCSQPTTVHQMLSLLAVPRGARVLDVGSGSGWTTALLAQLVGEGGRVDGVEVRPALVAQGQANLERAHLPWARIHQAPPATLGLPDGAPYDRILVSASAGRLPASLIDQLADDGRMVVPIGTTMTIIERTGGHIRTRHAGQYRFVPLLDPEASLGE
ncbi:protein-L-isoaspartate O-methyltransferase [Ruania suaedae]|uniref:protein-L-isoaspartate O-methyltransferase family protein n=1 Tax=Ruania suaedae TaxID=2897774 RepID=UPI001E4E03E5|nr:protein-L-isoaspartate O-methyltransferase [Ruania suaedae]UFU03243.1 protein-L-isoaspartate O-methyltransferase [Ruania suaedae]